MNSTFNSVHEYLHQTVKWHLYLFKLTLSVPNCRLSLNLSKATLTSKKVKQNPVKIEFFYRSINLSIQSPNDVLIENARQNLFTICTKFVKKEVTECSCTQGKRDGLGCSPDLGKRKEKLEDNNLTLLLGFESEQLV